MLYVFLFTFFRCHSFSPYWPLAFSFPHRRYKIFMLFFQQNSSPFFLTSRFSSFSVIHVNVDIKIKSKERIGFIVVILLSLKKVRVAMRFTTETRRYLKYKISPRLTRRGGRTYGRFCGNQNFLESHFLTHGAPLRALPERESSSTIRYKSKCNV